MRFRAWPFVLALVISAAGPAGRAAPAKTSPAASAVTTVACRAMEVLTDGAHRTTVIVFHQRDDASRAALAELLRAYSGDAVEIQAGDDHSWQRATVFRLKSCFGRGLLLVPSGAAQQLKEGDEFHLKLLSE